MMAPTKVFVSHAQADQSLAEDIRRALRSMHVEVWSDDQLTAGENWSDVLRGRLRDSQYFLLLLTPRSVESSWVLQELGAAWALGKEIIPITSDRRLLDRLPVDLSHVQTITVNEIAKLEEIIQHTV
jgi:hypothetical protein